MPSLTRKGRKSLASRNPLLSAFVDTSLAAVSSGMSLASGYVAFEVFKAYSWPKDVLLKITQLFWIILGFSILSVLIRDIARPGISRKAVWYVLQPLMALLLIFHSLDKLMPVVAYGRSHHLGSVEFGISFYGLIVGTALMVLLN